MLSSVYSTSLMKTAAIIAAAGLGKRMGAGVPKQYLEICGRPIICHTLEAFAKADFIGEMVIVVEHDRVEAFKRDIIDAFHYPKSWKVTAGGAVRQESVRNGLLAISSNPDIVLVHDGVRPFITYEQILSIASEAFAHKAAILASPVKETIKRVQSDGVIEETVDRSELWTAETPQGFSFELLARAVESAVKDGFVGTDEASLVEHLGEKVRVVRGDGRNIKITNPADIKIAEAIINSSEVNK